MPTVFSQGFRKLATHDVPATCQKRCCEHEALIVKQNW